MERIYDIKRGAEIYSSIYGTRLKNWILTGKIKKEDVLVWRSGLSGWRKPEELEELKPYFKLAEKTCLEVKEGAQRKQEHVLRKKKIKNVLIIDDEKDLCWLLSDALKQEGYNVSIANTKKQGMFRLTKESPDLLLLDLKLPDGSGIKFFPRIRKLKPKPAVIVVSAYGDEESREKIKNEGAYAFVDKPFTVKDILNHIKHCNRLEARI